MSSLSKYSRHLNAYKIFAKKCKILMNAKNVLFISSNKRNYDVHLTTRKHREMTMNDDNLANLAKMFCM